MRVCPACGQENPDVAKFCLACCAPLEAPAPVPSAEERKLVTVLFTDIVGSTAKAEQMDPEDVRARLAPYHTRLRTELEQRGGTVEKFIGDAVVALFGAPTAHEDDPERAVRAALAIRHAIEDLNAEDEWLDLQVRIGVNTGEALVVVGAKASEGEGMASGDVMNTAARLQSAAPVNGILVGALTHEATRDAIKYRDAEPIAAKGKSEPVQVWEAVDVVEATAEAVASEGVALVGREQEVAALADAWQAAIEVRRPVLVTIVGPAGVGKSRLLAEFAHIVDEDGSVHWGRCLPYGEGITYWPVTEIVKSTAGILQSDDRDAIAEKLGSFLEQLGTDDLDELRTIAAALSNLIGIPTSPRGTYVTSEISQGELHWGIRRTLQLLSAERPVALVFEDLHWAEPTLLELLAYIAADEADAPIALICSARPDLAETSPGFLGDAGRRRTVALDTLDERQAAALLAELLGDDELTQTPFARALIANAGGNPLFLEETVRTLRDQGLVDLERWRHEDVDRLPVPTSVQGLISSRLDRLEPGDKRLAHNAAVVGAVFWAGAVRHLGAGDEGPAPDPGGLDRLERRDFVLHSAVSTVANEEEYAFKHILMRDVAYEQIPKGRRAKLHVRFSDWVTVLLGSADEFVEIVAWHLEQACRLSRELARSPIEPPLVQAAGALANAARRAEAREGLKEAHWYYTRALDVLGDVQAELQLELRVRRGDMAMMLGQLKEASGELLEVAEGAARLGRADIECEAMLLLGDIDQRQGRTSDADERLTKARRLASLTNNAALQARVEFVLATFVGDYEGRQDDAIENLRAAIATAEEVDDRALVAEGHLRIAAALMNKGDFAGTEVELRRCLELAADLGSHRVEAEATSWLGLVTYELGDPAEGERLCRQARTWFERTADSYFQVQNLVNGLASFALANGRPDEAEAYLREAIPVALQIGGWILIDTYRHLVYALVALDRIDDAREIVGFAARNLPEEDGYARSSLLLAEATVATAAGEQAAAATSFAEALRLIVELDMPYDVAKARTLLGRSLKSFGNVTGARAELERARAIYVRIGATTRRDAIDRELAELVEGPAPAGPSTV
jgi:class 3 adenylate cyclase/tetratricopeptide (TPR) repeat protein